MEATGDDTLESSRTRTIDGVRVLRSAAIYGPNASGKSALLDAMAIMGKFVVSSARMNGTLETIPVEPFLLHAETNTAPTRVEWKFFAGQDQYRYGFSADGQAIHAEWLFRRRKRAREAGLFTREFQSISPNLDQFPEARILAALEKSAGGTPVRENALALSILAQFNGPVALAITHWFSRFRFNSGVSDKEYFSFTARRVENLEHRARLVAFAQCADFQIKDLSSQLIEFTSGRVGSAAQTQIEIRNDRLFRREIKTSHIQYGSDGEISGEVEFDLAQQESKGTQKFIGLSGILDDAVENESVVVVDEFDARLHPLLTRWIFEWFHSPDKKGGAQFIFATHDVGLMDPEYLRRDQIWFCEKDEKGASSLFSLAEFDPNTVRPTSKFSRQYLLGLLGAVPKLAQTENIPCE